MYFAFIKVFKIECKEDIILALQSVGVTKGSIYASLNLDKTLKDEETFIASFFRTEEDIAREQFIITTLMEDKKTAEHFLNNLRESGMDIDNEDILRLVVMPVSTVFDSEDGWKEYD